MSPVVFLPLVIGGLIVLAATTRLRQLAALLRARGAVVAARAVRPDSLPRPLMPLVPRLLQRGVLHATPAGALWLDEGAYGAYGRRLAVLMAGGAVLGAVMGWLAWRLGAASR